MSSEENAESSVDDPAESSKPPSLLERVREAAANPANRFVVLFLI